MGKQKDDLSFCPTDHLGVWKIPDVSPHGLQEGLIVWGQLTGKVRFMRCFTFMVKSGPRRRWQFLFIMTSLRRFVPLQRSPHSRLELSKVRHPELHCCEGFLTGRLWDAWNPHCEGFLVLYWTPSTTFFSIVILQEVQSWTTSQKRKGKLQKYQL